jgi:voltage-gated potassium channel Kch
MSLGNDDDHEPPDVGGLSGHAVIAGFGVPGRAVADLVHARGMSFCVIEKNEQTIERCRKSGLCMVEGDAGDAVVLRKAGLDRATLFACTVPDDKAMLAAVEEARRVNPDLRIIARCRYVSSGMQAKAHGADEVVIEEQAVAQAFEALLTADPHSDMPPRVMPK